MMRWLRPVSPLTTYLLFALLVQLTWTLGEIVAVCLGTRDVSAARDLLLNRLPDMHWENWPPSALILAAGIYGIYRVAAFHPTLRTGYGSWLASTPWRVPMPLPFGPVHLVWQDAIIVGLPFAVAWLVCGISAFHILKLFLFGYFATLWLACWLTAQPTAFYALGFLVPGLLYEWRVPLKFSGFALAAYAVSLPAIRGSLRSFMELPAGFGIANLLAGFRIKLDDKPLFGWPFSQLSPAAIGPFFGRLHGTLTALLGGWCFFVILEVFSELSRRQSDEHAGLIWVAFALMMSSWIAAFQLWERHSPLGLLARLRTGHLIVPSYDQVLIAPALALVACGTIPGSLTILGVDALVAAALAFTVALWVLLNLGPTRERWLLTGYHHIVPGGYAGVRGKGFV